MFAANWTFKAELSLRRPRQSQLNDRLYVSAHTSSLTSTVKDTFSIARVGVNYIFGGPVVAKYLVLANATRSKPRHRLGPFCWARRIAQDLPTEKVDRYLIRDAQRVIEAMRRWFACTPRRKTTFTKLWRQGQLRDRSKGGQPSLELADIGRDGPDLRFGEIMGDRLHDRRIVRLILVLAALLIPVALPTVDAGKHRLHSTQLTLSRAKQKYR
jgi:hypothetical protein